MIADAPAPPRECVLTGEERVFFLHLPKTAGTTLGNALESHFPRRRIFPHYSLGVMEQVVPGMCDSYTYFRGHFEYDVLRRMIGEDPICITMLRDPIERFISHFAQWERHGLGGEDIGFDAFPFDSLADYVRHDEAVVATWNLDIQTVAIGDNAVFADIDALAADLFAARRKHRRTDPVAVDYGPKMLARARERLDRFAFVGIAERFQESLFLLSYTFGWRPLLDVERRNVSPRKPQRDGLDAETVARIASFNTLDLALYDHAARLFAERYTRMTADLVRRYLPERAPLPAAPLPDALMAELIERHYAERFAAAHPPVRRMHIDFEEPVAGQGWYPPETLPGYGTVRWTGPGTTATLDLPLATDDDLTVRFRVIWALAADVLASLTLAVNGQPVALHTARDADGATICTAVVPWAMLASDMPFTRLAFAVNRTTPVDAGDDPRCCGLLFNWIAINP